VRIRMRLTVDTLAWLIEDAFEGDLAHSLLVNLRHVPDELWNTVPAAVPLPTSWNTWAGASGCIKLDTGVFEPES
jgi:hypothetical protein